MSLASSGPYAEALCEWDTPPTTPRCFRSTSTPRGVTASPRSLPDWLRHVSVCRKHDTGPDVRRRRSANLRAHGRRSPCRRAGHLQGQLPLRGRERATQASEVFTVTFRAFVSGVDTDSDGTSDEFDNCLRMSLTRLKRTPTTTRSAMRAITVRLANRDQLDLDNNGIGDACPRGDINGDGVLNDSDVAPFVAVLLGLDNVPATLPPPMSTAIRSRTVRTLLRFYRSYLEDRGCAITQ